MLGSFLALLARFFERPQPAAAPLAGCVAPDSAPLVVASSTPVSVPVAEAAPAIDVEKMQGLIGQVSAVTSAVADDVGKHRINVQEISSELTAVANNDPAAVASIISKLVAANQELQSRLERAEGTLQAHSRQLHDAVMSARTDGLTGLLNRRALDEELRRCLVELQGQGRPAALLMIDVDHFKKFNDTFGHVAGDQALIHVAKVLQSQSRAADIVARFGGEEFSVVFTAASAGAIRERAERLRQAIGRRTVAYDGQEMHVTASAGLTEALADDTVADWLKRADAALYAAKRAGRDCAFESCNDALEPLTRPDKEDEDPTPTQPLVARAVGEAATELATEAFSDTSFVQSIAKRIAEWKRGGATMTVVLARVDQDSGDPDSRDEGAPDDSGNRRPIRVALQMARACVREMDLLTRWEQDGLAILLPSTSAADAKTVARRLRNALATESATSAADPVTVSLGIAEGIEGNDAKRVLERAWIALEAARCAGPASIFVHDGLKAVAVKLAPAAARA